MPFFSSLAACVAVSMAAPAELGSGSEIGGSGDLTTQDYTGPGSAEISTPADVTTQDYTTSPRTTDAPPPFNASGLCPQECKTNADCDCACELSAFGIGVGLQDPSDLTDLGITLEILMKVAKRGLHYASRGLTKSVVKALKDLVAVLRNARPVIYIKVSWDYCEKSGCFIFWDEYKCKERESDWIKVPIPASLTPYDLVGYWPPQDSWDTYEDEINGAVDAAVDAACEGKCD